jgi:hypothetical protein
MKAATRGRTRLSNPAMFNVKGSILVKGSFNVSRLFNNNGNLRQADAM